MNNKSKKTRTEQIDEMTRLMKEEIQKGGD
jgi:hypothetical protein